MNAITQLKQTCNPLEIVRLDDTQRQRMAAHLLSLSPADREMRFSMSRVSDQQVAAYVAKRDFARDIILGMRNGAGEIVALVELFPSAHVCEAAFSVDSQRRGSGLAGILVQLAIEVATSIGAKTLHAQCVTANQPMRRLFKRFGMDVETDAGEVIATLALPVINHLSANDVAALIGRAA